MYYQKEVILAEVKTRNAMLTVKPSLHYREEKKGKSYYKGKVAWRIFEFREENKNPLTYYLSKKEAKYLFYRLLHDTCETPLCFYGGKKGENPIAKRLLIERIEQKERIQFKIEIAQGAGETTPNGAIVFKKEANKKEFATIFLSIDELKQLAMDCLDYIRHEELIAQLHGNPLQDQITHTSAWASEDTQAAKKEPELFDFTDFFAEEKAFADILEMVGEQEKEAANNITNPQPLVDELQRVLQTYLLQAATIPLSKSELKDVLHQIKELQSLVKALKIINQTR